MNDSFEVERRDVAAELRDLGRVIAQQWWVILLCAVLAGSVAWAWSASKPKEYEASAKLLLRQTPLEPQNTGVPGQDPNRQTATDIQLVALPKVAARVVKRLHLGLPAGVALGKVSVSGGGDSNVLAVAARDERPKLATRLANGFAREYIRFRARSTRRQLSRAATRVERRARAAGAEGALLRQQARQLRVAASLDDGDAQVIQPATVPGVPASPRPKRNLALGLICGLLLGLGLAFLRDRLDKRVRDEDDVRAIFPGVPIVAEIPRPARGNDSKLMLVESFHALRSNLELLHPDRRLQTLLITSAGAGDGKSSTAANLALAMRESHHEALLVEADLRRPALSKALGASNGRGTAKVLAGTDRLEQSVKEARVTAPMNGDGPMVVMPGRINLVPAGPLPERPRALLSDEALGDLLHQADQRTETVIIDGPPVGLFSDMMPLAKRVDGVLVVVRLYHSSTTELKRFAARLSDAGIAPLGLVVVGGRADASRYSAYER